MAELLKGMGLKKHYYIKEYFKESKIVKALDGLDFSLEEKKTLAVVGESGCGKSTLAKILMHIEPKTDGKIFLNGKEIRDSSEDINNLRIRMQMIFQDPYSSINPRKKAWQIIGEPLLIKGEESSKQIKDKSISVMEKVGLRPEMAERYPHMFSGGQRQRIGIARALILRPKIIICDEPVSALDVSIQAQVINLLIDLQDEFNLSYIFISHDLSVVRHLADEVLVMYLGKVVEKGSREDLFTNPQHPYTKALLSSTPEVYAKDRKNRVALTGELPSPLNPPKGCAFHKRCPISQEVCTKEEPILKEFDNRLVSCHLVDGT